MSFLEETGAEYEQRTAKEERPQTTQPAKREPSRRDDQLTTQRQTRLSTSRITGDPRDFDWVP